MVSAAPFFLLYRHAGFLTNWLIVLVKLTVKHPRPELHYPERRVTLEQKNTSVLIIGRSSKRFDNLEAKSDNCYFDSPVMSREHAKITVDWYHKVNDPPCQKFYRLLI